MAKLSEKTLAASTAGLDKVLAVLVHLKLCNDNVAWVDGILDALAVKLLTVEAIDVDAHLAKLDISDLALTVLMLANDELDFVITADWEALDVMSLLKLLGKRCTKGDMLLVLRSVEKSLTDLTWLAGNEWVGLHHRKDQPHFTKIVALKF